MRKLILLKFMVFNLCFAYVHDGIAQEFVTKWSFATAETELKFNALTLPGGVSYTWSAWPSGNSGVGSFTQAPFGEVTLSNLNIVAGDLVTLSLAPNNLRRFGAPDTDARLRLIEVSQWGSVVWTSMLNAFLNCSNLDVTATDVPNLSAVQNIAGMFNGCSSLTGNSRFEDWNTSNITNMARLFQNCTNFNQDISHWNTANVTNMTSLFFGASSFNQPIGSWNTSSLVNMNSMFRNATSFNQPIGTWNTSSVNSMDHTFRGASVFNQSIENWNTQGVTSMFHMFNGAAAFNQPLGNWDVAAVTNMSFLFNNASSFNQSLGNWTLHQNVDLERMLSNCGMNCSSYSATLKGWHDNNPALLNRTLGANSMLYNLTIANNERQSLINNRGWIITGDNFTNSFAYLVPSNTTIQASQSCDFFTNPSNHTQKVIQIDVNGNALDLAATSVAISNSFVASLPMGMATVANGGGYYELSDGTDIIRVSRRLTSIVSAGNFNNNGGVLVRVYHSPLDLVNISTDAVPNGINPISSHGWFKASANNAQSLIHGLTPSHPFIGSSEEIFPVSTGIENGVHYAEFLLTSFSTIGYFSKSSATPLPVTMKSFNVNCNNEQITVNWVTASELNASHYIVQNSRDGQNWVDLGEVDAAGTTTRTTHYSFETRNQGGLSYFRLVQVDLDGATEIFGPLSADCEIESNSLKVYPNPAAEKFSVLIQTSEPQENVILELIDFTGRVILSKTCNIGEGSTTIPFDSDDLKSGVYLIRIQGAQDKFQPIQLVRM